MNNEGVFNRGSLRFNLGTDHIGRGSLEGLGTSRRAVVGAILIVALIAFELFNFDTTRYALDYLLGDVRFWGLRWATILAVAFCAIDFAGLARLFTPEQGREEPKTVWYLMGAWLLGASMNAVMTWWAVSLTLLTHDFGNEVLSREQLLEVVPVFVAALVWLTRILFIGALSVTGEQLFKPEERDDFEDRAIVQRPMSTASSRPARPSPRMARGSTAAGGGLVGRRGAPITARRMRAAGQQSYRRAMSGKPSDTRYGPQARRRSR